MEKSRLAQARTLALRRNDFAEVEQIDAKLALLTGDSARNEENVGDMLAKVNERNRKANLEAVRKAELLEIERKRRERKLAASANGTATPPADRLRMLSKTLDSRFVSLTHHSSGSYLCPPDVNLHSRLFGQIRPGTPGTPMRSALETPRALTPLLSNLADSKPLDPNTSFEDAVLDSVEIDLGDF
ncbi:hypothetical protein PHLCEN_2v8982 [Hermanssonia centrifuga]|uniref:Uncharacterized protein n=1 Tax=Hermanssonia centrifuga TaxID=98765 RepID=A0A2R6NS76_9APHY|nr:hypothetical protein PHLCEN_2v8982 [Hermanssonia centrifuga]